MNLILLEIERDILSYFGNDLNKEANFSHQIRLWKIFWTESNSKPSSLTGTLNEIDKNLFKIIKIPALVPAISSTVERVH